MKDDIPENLTIFLSEKSPQRLLLCKRLIDKLPEFKEAINFNSRYFGDKPTVHSEEEWKGFILFYDKISKYDCVSHLRENLFRADNISNFAGALKAYVLENNNSEKIKKSVNDALVYEFVNHNYHKTSLTANMNQIKRLFSTCSALDVPIPQKCIDHIRTYFLGLSQKEQTKLLEVIPQELHSQINAHIITWDDAKVSDWMKIASSGNDTQITDLLKNLGRENGAKFVAHFAAHSKKLESTQTNVFYEAALNAYPWLTQYIYHGAYGNVISDSGMRLIADNWQKKHPGTVLSLKISRAKNEFKDDLKRFMNGKEKYGFFITHPSDMDFGHVTPICVRRNDNGSFTILNFDSVGTEYLGSIEELFEGFQNVTLYASDIKRQADHSNCPVFTIKDILKVAKNPDRYFDFAEKNSESSGGCMLMRKLPPELMISLQLWQSLDTYFKEEKKAIKDAQDKQLLMKIENKKTKHMREERVKDKSGQMVNKTRNLYIHNKLIKYQNYLILTTLANGIAETT